MSETAGVLYIVATPIGNLGDMSQRAIEVLQSVALIAAEDTRNSLKLLNHFGIQRRMLSLHEHNERERGDEILQQLSSGESVALISDAGTPLISDPGYSLVSRAQDLGYRVVPIPGPSALITALSVAGLPTDRFCFEGFLPSRAQARDKVLADLQYEPRTLVFYEAPHRLQESLQAIARSFGAERRVTLARELTKRFETVHRDSAQALADWVGQDPEQLKGECVLVVEGAEPRSETQSVEIHIETLLKGLLQKLSVKDAAALCASLTGRKKNILYEQALRLQQKDP